MTIATSGSDGRQLFVSYIREVPVCEQAQLNKMIEDLSLDTTI
jgi:hypothetical protein